jgi:hypothetical protein
MQRQLSTVTDGLNRRSGIAVHVNLPVKRRQCCEVVLAGAVHLHPRQALHASGLRVVDAEPAHDGDEKCLRRSNIGLGRALPADERILGRRFPQALRILPIRLIPFVVLVSMTLWLWRLRRTHTSIRVVAADLRDAVL